MTHQDEINTIQGINDYARGKLSNDKIEKLWTTFLKEPEWLDYLETELYLLWVFKDTKWEKHE